MSRPFNVFFGAVLIFGLWTWMLAAGDWDLESAGGIFLAIGRVVGACYMTGPIYREYLR